MCIYFVVIPSTGLYGLERILVNLFASHTSADLSAHLQQRREAICYSNAMLAVQVFSITKYQ